MATGLQPACQDCRPEECAIHLWHATQCAESGLVWKRVSFSEFFCGLDLDPSADVSPAAFQVCQERVGQGFERGSWRNSVKGWP